MDLTFKELAAANAVRAAEWNRKAKATRSLEFAMMELAGEVGEACNIAKKLVRTQSGLVGGMPEEEALEALQEEIADVVICASLVANQIGFSLGGAVVDKFNKTSGKYQLETTL